MLPNENTQRPDVILLFKIKVIVLEFKTGGNKVTLTMWLSLWIIKVY